MKRKFKKSKVLHSNNPLRNPFTRERPTRRRGNGAGEKSRINIRAMFVIHGEILFNRSRKGAMRDRYIISGWRSRLKRREPAAELMACVRDARWNMTPRSAGTEAAAQAFQLLKWNLAAAAGVFHFVTYSTLETR